jgi:serine/threonine protein kinase
VIHRDLKPDNMLLTKDWKLKLTDFGEARAANLGATMTTVGTPIYIAPEVMHADHYDTRCDTYSYGVCLCAMVSVQGEGGGGLRASAASRARASEAKVRGRCRRGAGRKATPLQLLGIVPDDALE